MVMEGCPYTLEKVGGAYILKYKGEVLPFQADIRYHDSADSIATAEVTFAFMAEKPKAQDDTEQVKRYVIGPDRPRL